MSQPPFGQQPSYGHSQPYQQPPGVQQPVPKNNTVKILLFILVPIVIIGLLCVGMLLMLLLPAVTAARGAAREAMTGNSLRQVNLGLINFHEVNKQFPYTADQLDESGQPRLSWRVHILPYLDEQALYQQFHLDEPWDSPHNESLLEKMPEIFQVPDEPTTDGTTMIRSISGDGGMMPLGPGVSIGTVSDGTSNTVFTVVANSGAAVPWTSPEPFDNRFSSLRVFARDRIMVGFVDGSVSPYPVEKAEPVWKAVIGRQDGIADSLFP